MKTPRKFLAQLTSRRPSANAQQSSIGNSADSKALESEAEHTPALRLSLRVAAGPPAPDEEVSIDHASMASEDKAKGDDDVAQAPKQAIVAEAAHTTARHQVDHSGAEVNSLVPRSAASTKSHGKPRVKRRERGKSANGESTAQSAVAPKPHQSLLASSSRDLFFHGIVNDLTEKSIRNASIRSLWNEVPQRSRVRYLSASLAQTAFASGWNPCLMTSRSER